MQLKVFSAYTAYLQDYKCDWFEQTNFNDIDSHFDVTDDVVLKICNSD